MGIIKEKVNSCIYEGMIRGLATFEQLSKKTITEQNVFQQLYQQSNKKAVLENAFFGLGIESIDEALDADFEISDELLDELEKEMQSEAVKQEIGIEDEDEDGIDTPEDLYSYDELDDELEEDEEELED